MSVSNSQVEPFRIKDCSLVAITTGKKAQNLRELRHELQSIHPGSIYYHFWGGLLRPRFDDPQYHNDFASWSHYALHDDILAERLAVIDPCDFTDLEALRLELEEVIEQRLEEIDRIPWALYDRQFQFVRSQIVVFDTGKTIEKPEVLADAVAAMSVGSIFYHFIDARRRDPRSVDDFRAWLSGFGDTYEVVCSSLAAVDPYFVTLNELRGQLSWVFEKHF